jgi:hypothetical protein
MAEAACGLRNVFYTNSGLKRLIAEFIGGPAPVADGSAALSRAQQQAEAKDRRILQIEQQRASVKAENEELRNRLTAAER